MSDIELKARELYASALRANGMDFTAERVLDMMPEEGVAGSVRATIDAIIAALSPQWQPIDSAPKNGAYILLGHFNSAGNWRTLRGRWFSAERIEMEWENAHDFDAGWYEESVEADDIPNVWPTTPSHWQPLPAPPEVV